MTLHIGQSFSGEKYARMDIDERFCANLLAAMRERGYSAAELSRRAGLNARAVKDIEERRAKSPKLSTAIKLASALGLTVEEIIRGTSRAAVNAEIADLLSHLSEHDARRLLAVCKAYVAPASSEN